MINVQDLRAGTAFLLEEQPYVCLKYEHIKMGRGSATIKIKAKNLLTGAIVDKSFINSARVEKIDTGRRRLQYLYSHSGQCVFVDPGSYEQVEIGSEVVGDQVRYLQQGAVVDVLFWGDKPLAVELPPKMEFVVTETDPGIKGNSAVNVYKPARLDNGLTVRVPLFVEEGDRVVVDTRDGSYVERVRPLG